MFVVLLVAGVLLVGVLCTAGWFFLRPSKAAAEKDGKGSKEAAVKGVLHLENFVVNLADPEDNRFLRVGIDLGLEHRMPDEGGGNEPGGVPLAPVRDTILAVLTTWRSETLLTCEGKEKLKQEIVKALRQRVPELGVREVYFTDFLVQR